MDKADYTKENIKFLTEVFKLLTSLLFIISSATSALVFKQFSVSVSSEVHIATTGFVTMVVLMMILGYMASRIYDYIDEFNQEAQPNTGA